MLIPVLQFPLAYVIPPMLHTHLYVPEGQPGEASEPSTQHALSDIGEHWTEKYFHIWSSGPDLK
jgi:hypothetical protein